MLDVISSVIILCSSINLGDVGAAHQIIKEMKNRAQIGACYNIDANNSCDSVKEEYSKACQACGDQKQLVLVVGEKGISALNSLHNAGQINREKSFVAVVTHQCNALLEDKELPVDHLSIPGTALKDHQVQDHYFHIPGGSLMSGMPIKSMSNDELKQRYDSWIVTDSGKPQVGHPYIVVILPGDAPDSNGIMHYFTQKSAEQLAAFVKKIQDKTGYQVLIHNGPRTGKHDPQMGNIACSHTYEEGQNPIAAKDLVSTYFEEYFYSLGGRGQFFNFAFCQEADKKRVESVYHQLLYLAMNNKESFFIVPGESVSMMEEVPYYCRDAQRVVVFEPDSMNDAHRAILSENFQEGYISIFDEQGDIIVPESMNKKCIDDAANVALSIVMQMV